MIKLNIIFSKEEEVRRIISTLHDLDWFAKNNYNILLPANIGANSLGDNEENTVSTALSQEFTFEDYEKSRNYIDQNSLDMLKKLEDSLRTAGLIPRSEYTLLLTKYGTAGSYHFPDRIIINIKMKYEKGLVRTIAHEIIHLSIHELVVNHKVPHWQKERVVDLLLSRCLPEYAKFQNMPIDTKFVDQVFSDNFPDVDLILTKIS
jgi:hypothetical protein